MPTTVSSTVGTTGTYASWAAWEAAAPANLVTADQIWEGQGQNQEFYEAGGVVTIGGQTTDSTRFMRMTTASGASFADNANKLTNELRYNASNGCGLRSGNFVPTVFVGTAYTQITKLQIQASVNDTAIPATGSNVTIAQCIIQAGGRVISLEGGGTSLCTNTLFIRSANGGGHGIFFSYGTAYVYNCAVIRPSNLTPGDNGIRNEGGTLTVKNTSVFGFSTFETGGTAASNNNATDLASGAGTSSQHSLTFTAQFEQSSAATALDLRTKAGSAQLANGADLSGSGVTVDIVGTSRSAPYAIGVWQGSSATAYTADVDPLAYEYQAGAVDVAFGRVADVAPLAYRYAAGAVDVGRTITVDVAPLAYLYAAGAVDATYQQGQTGDTHDGYLRRTRRQRAMDAADRRRRDEEAIDRNALRLSLEAALGMAAEVVEDAPAEAVAAVEVAVDAARAIAPSVDLKAPSVDLAAAARALARLHAAIEAAARAKAAADDEDVEILLRAL